MYIVLVVVRGIELFMHRKKAPYKRSAMIKLVLADMDNTLIPFGRAGASERTLAAIHACLDAGIAFGPASGRNRTEVAGFLSYDEAVYQTAVLVNGQQVYLRGKLIRETTLDEASLRRTEDFIRIKQNCALLIYRSDGTCDWVGDDPERLGEFMINAMHNGSVRHETLPVYPVVKAGIVALLPHDEELALQQELAEACPELDFLNTVPQWFDVIPHGWSKVRGIEVLEQELGITPDEICVFGDAPNDLPMFAHVTHSCAVANATPEAQAAARWHVGASADDGVAIALEQIAEAACASRQAGSEVLPAFMQ